MRKANDSGQMLVQFGIALPIFLLLILGTIDFGYLFFTESTLQNAVLQAGRYAITGECITGSDGSCSQSRYNSIIQTLQTASLGLATIGDINLTCTNGGGGCPNNAGGPGDIVTITVTYPYKFMAGPIGNFFSGNSYTIKISAAFTNEPFPPGAS